MLNMRDYFIVFSFGWYNNIITKYFISSVSLVLQFECQILKSFLSSLGTSCCWHSNTLHLKTFLIILKKTLLTFWKVFFAPLDFYHTFHHQNQCTQVVKHTRFKMNKNIFLINRNFFSVFIWVLYKSNRLNNMEYIYIHT